MICSYILRDYYESIVIPLLTVTIRRIYVINTTCESFMEYVKSREWPFELDVYMIDECPNCE